MKYLWFKRKTYGWGWVPVTSQGWFLTFAYVGIVTHLFLRVDERSHSVSDTLVSLVFPFLFFTLLFLSVLYKKWDYPKWQWGEKR